MRESKVETYLTAQVEARGGLCEKHVSPGLVGVPDRLITWPVGVMHLAETKATGKKPRGNQLRDHARRAARNVRVYVLDTHSKIDTYILGCSNYWRGVNRV